MKRLPPLAPGPIKDRQSMLFLEHCKLDVENGVMVAHHAEGNRTQIPLGSIASILLEPGTSITHEAVKLAATVGTLLIWVGEAAVRLYACGQPGGARSDHLLYQAKLALDDRLRLNVVRKMFEIRFGVTPPTRRSVDQLRGMEGVRVRENYRELADRFGIKWNGRRYDRNAWQFADAPNRCLSTATSCLYGVAEAAILAAGYAPAIGFLHTGKARSFVFDIADLVKFETVVPAAFQAVGEGKTSSSEVRYLCRNYFRETRLLMRLIPLIDEVLSAGGIDKPSAPDDSQPVAFSDRKGVGDPGMRT